MLGGTRQLAIGTLFVLALAFFSAQYIGPDTQQLTGMAGKKIEPMGNITYHDLTPYQISTRTYYDTTAKKTIRIHLNCQDLSCVVFRGNGQNRCFEDRDCVPTRQLYHRACKDNACVYVSGRGTNKCSTNTDCGGTDDTPPPRPRVSKPKVSQKPGSNNETKNDTNTSAPAPKPEPPKPAPTPEPPQPDPTPEPPQPEPEPLKPVPTPQPIEDEKKYDSVFTRFLKWVKNIF